MLRTTLLLSVCLTTTIFVWGDDQPVSALTPANGVSVMVRVEKIAVEERSGPYDWLIKNENIIRLVSSTNEHRARMGLTPVVLDTSMCLDAQRHADWMASFGSFQHSSLPYMEIIFNGVSSPEAAVQGWIASPQHHAIMQSGTKVGFGYQLRGGHPYCVGVFQ